MLSGIVLLCAAALVVGYAVAPGVPGAAPATGLALLIVLCDIVREAGGDGSALATTMALCAGSAALTLLRRRDWASWRRPSWWLCGALAFVVSMVPYLAAGHLGFLGPSILDDSANHVFWAWSIQGGHVTAGVIQQAYPIGPHSLVAGLATLDSTRVDHAFEALNALTPILLALTAYDVLPAPPGGLRAAAAAVCGTVYLVSALYSESAYKEPIVALLVLGVVAVLRAPAPSPSTEGARAARAALLGLLAGAAGLVEGFPGVAWTVGAIVMWLGMRVLRGRRPHHRSAAPLAVAGGVFALSTIGEWGRLRELAHIGGNVPFFLPTAEAGGIWGGAFPSDSTSLLCEPILDVILGLGVLAVVRAHWRRSPDPVIAAAISAGLIYVAIRLTQDAYLSSKALAILSPLYVVLVLSILTRPSAARRRRREVLRLTLLAAFLAACLVSTAGVLIAAPVGATAREPELARLRQRIAGAPTLMLVPTHYGPWDLRSASVVSLIPYGPKPVGALAEPALAFAARAARHLPGEQNVDLATLPPGLLDRFRFAVTTGGAQPAAPPGWVRELTTPAYMLWKRVAATGPVKEHGGRRLDCAVPAIHAAAASGGRAELATDQIALPGSGWRQVNGGPVAVTTFGASAPLTGTRVRQRLDVPPGRWQLAVQYQSTTPIDLSAGNLRSVLPADLDVYGALWPAGVVEVGRRAVWVTVTARPRRWLRHEVLVGRLVARRVEPGRPSVVPIATACGQAAYWVSDTPGAARPVASGA